MHHTTIIIFALAVGILFVVPAHAADLTDGTVAYYTFDGVLTDGIGTNDGSMVAGSASYETGIDGEAFNCTSGRRISIPDANSLDITTNWTIAFFWKARTWATADSQVTTKGSQSWSATVGSNAAKRPSIGKNGVDQLNTNNAFSGTVWYAYVAVHTPGRSLIYVNGVLEGNATKADLAANTAAMTICGQDTTYFFNGLVDNLLISNRAWTQSDIDLYNSTNGAIFGSVPPRFNYNLFTYNDTFFRNSTPTLSFSTTIADNATLYINSSSDTFTTSVGQNTQTNISVTTSLTAGQEYSWYIVAQNQGGSNTSTVRNFYIPGSSGGASTLACLVVSNGCSIMSMNGCNYVQ